MTYLTDHEMGRETDSRLASAWFGANQTRKIKAVEKMSSTLERSKETYENINLGIANFR